VTFTIGNLNQNTQFDGTIVNGTGGTVSGTKVGTGSLTLTGNNTYTGNTTVAGGTPIARGGAQNPILNGPAAATLNAGKLVLDYNGGSDPLTQVQGILGPSYPTFTSGQIHTSNAADPTKGIGYSDNTSTSQLTVKYTYFGDANLDGQVT